MTQYINKSALVAEIENRYNECLKRAKIIDSDYWNANADAYRNVLAILNDTIEVKKELSIEEKAKRYDEAIERAKGAHNSAKSDKENGVIDKITEYTIQLTETIFPELKESEDDKIRQKLIKLVKMSSEVGGFALHKWEADEMLAWLEKQAEQKSVDKAEPKFHEGEWITNGDYTWEIVEVKPLDYILQSQDGNIVDDTISHVDEQFHSFTIEDAKDGDILVKDLYPHGMSICLFKEFNPHIFTMELYCSINKKGQFIHNHCAYYYRYDVTLYPATKEQRDLLFQKMHEAGYEWNAEKKELKEIEQKPVFEMITPEESLGIDSDTYNKIVDECIYGEQKPVCGEEQHEKESLSDIENRIINFAMQFHDNRMKPEAEWEDELKMLRDNIKIDTWNKEDEKILDGVITNYESGYLPSVEKRDEIIEKLKSLKERYTWKPSDEQINLLEELAEDNNQRYFYTILRSLCEQLKKLKG